MIAQDLHTHSDYDDGRGTLREVAEAAAEKGLVSIGLSGHTPMPFENDWTMTEEGYARYLREVPAVIEKMRGRIEVLMGIEYDALCHIDYSLFDYVIGSAHYVVKDGVPLSIDETLEISEQAVAAFGDADAVAEAYFETVGDFADNDEIDIVGHFDLITKFNEQKRLFDTDSPRYRAAARRAMERLVAAGKIFEINAGAMNRGYRTEPDPSVALLRQLRELGGRIILSSDAHSPQSVYGGFEALRAIALDCGFTEVWQYIDGAFRPQSL